MVAWQPTRTHAGQSHRLIGALPSTAPPGRTASRSEKIGYRVTMVDPSAEPRPTYEVFADGWLEGEPAWGRPVDLLELPDASLLVSDDHAGAIYRITPSSE